MLLANFDLLQIMEHHQNDSRDFLPTEKVENLWNFFDNSDCVIFEKFVSKFMITQNPEDNANIVSNLWLLKAWSLKEVADDLEALPCAEFSGQLVGLEQGHQSECKGIVTQL